MRFSEFVALSRSAAQTQVWVSNFGSRREGALPSTSRLPFTPHLLGPGIAAPVAITVTKATPASIASIEPANKVHHTALITSTSPNRLETIRKASHHRTEGSAPTLQRLWARSILVHRGRSRRFGSGPQRCTGRSPEDHFDDLANDSGFGLVVDRPNFADPVALFVGGRAGVTWKRPARPTR